MPLFHKLSSRYSESPTDGAPAQKHNASCAIEKSVMRLSRANTAVRIEVLFGMETPGAQEHAIDRGSPFPKKGGWGENRREFKDFIDKLLCAPVSLLAAVAYI